jgi:anti-sigma regulatory factor (Ser/Thr protein kinase)
MEEVGRNPARIIPMWRRFVDENAGPGVPVRGIGEPIWPGQSADELSECQRHESLLNVAFGDGRAWSLLCPYDSRSLPDDVLEEARRSHGPDADSAPDPFSGNLPEPVGPVAELRYGLADVADVRAFVRRFAEDAGLERLATENLVLAASELATNSIRHATGAGAVRLWTDADELLCEVRDGGLIEDPLVGRVVPPADALGGRGIWIVNQLCDLVQVRSSRQGTAVRVHMRRA